jgi:hypothetical protein
MMSPDHIQQEPDARAYDLVRDHLAQGVGQEVERVELSNNLLDKIDRQRDDAARGELVELAKAATQMEDEANRWARRAAAAALGVFLAVTIALGAALGGGG